MIKINVEQIKKHYTFIEEKWVCSVCGYVYDGDDFESEPDDYVCPVCGAKKDMFKLQ